MPLLFDPTYISSTFLEITTEQTGYSVDEDSTIKWYHPKYATLNNMWHISPHTMHPPTTIPSKMVPYSDHPCISLFIDKFKQTKRLIKSWIEYEDHNNHDVLSNELLTWECTCVKLLQAKIIINYLGRNNVSSMHPGQFQPTYHGTQWMYENHQQSSLTSLNSNHPSHLPSYKMQTENGIQTTTNGNHPSKTNLLVKMPLSSNATPFIILYLSQTCGIQITLNSLQNIPSQECM